MNKVKPFYIKITDDMTPQMVQDAFDKCVDAGAVANESVDDTKARYKYFITYLPSFDYFGVNKDFETYLNNGRCSYGAKAQEITLDQLDNWLGLDVEQEWKVGDVVTIKNPEGFGVWDEANKYLGSNGTVMAVFTNTNGKKVAAVSHDDNVCICWMISMLSKPETPEQKAERERLEAVKDMFLDMGYSLTTWESYSDDNESCGIEIEDLVINLGALYDAGYRKQ